MITDELKAAIEAAWRERTPCAGEAHEPTDPRQAMLDAAQWQIAHVMEDEDVVLHREVTRQPIDEVMVHRLLQSLLRRTDRKRDEERRKQLRQRGRKPDANKRRNRMIAYWVHALRDQCGGNLEDAIADIAAVVPKDPENRDRGTLDDETVRKIAQKHRGNK